MIDDNQSVVPFLPGLQRSPWLGMCGKRVLLQMDERQRLLGWLLIQPGDLLVSCLGCLVVWLENWMAS